ncbi:MAG: phosphatidate cytidylyltransferase [Spirochaetia bacterium]|nr:phosphatidate cytidylyltransferase [Spirochaetia bacterium]MCI7440525.1 phosphatidate cytidylyltransferase [Spirochaetia bacterium]
MNKFLSRLLVFFIGIPIVIGIVILPYFNHLPLHLFFILVSFFASNELYDIFKVNSKLPPKTLVVSLSVLVTTIAAVYSVLPEVLEIKIPYGQEIITFSYIISLFIVMAYEAIFAKEFETSNSKLAASAFIITYSGFLLTFASRLTLFRLNGQSITTPLFCVFALLVFFCDSIAWLFGMLFGKNNRGILKASPNKSLMGFFGGFVGSTFIAVSATYVWPEIFSGKIWKAVVLGISIALSSIVGDLVESVFKRCSGIKDSGKVVPGRGGMLDSIDSVLMSAPIYYLLISIMYGPF